jgi:hypothetical protein
MAHERKIADTFSRFSLSMARLRIERLATSRSTCPRFIIISKGYEVKKRRPVSDTKYDLLTPLNVSAKLIKATTNVSRYIIIHSCPARSMLKREKNA